MRCLPFCACAIISALGTFSAALADPFSAATIPGQAKWVMHLDVDALRTSPNWDLFRQRVIAAMASGQIKANLADIETKITMVERITGMKLPEGLHDFTLFGDAYDEADVCIRIHGDIDETLLTGFLKVDPEFRQEDHDGHTIMTWRDKGRDRLLYGAFNGKGSFILSASNAAVQEALDVSDGKSPAIKADSPLAPGAAQDEQPNLWLAARDLSEFDRAQSPIFSQMDAASAGFFRKNGKDMARVKVFARDEKAAQRMLAIAEGMKATVAMQAADEHATAKQKVLEAALEELSLSVEGKVVEVDWTANKELVEAALKAAVPEKTAANTAATNPGADKQ